MRDENYFARTLTHPDLRAAPINPDWIREGAPAARACELWRSADGAQVTAVWDCSAGAFRWYFGVDETVHILEGEVTVSDDLGHVRVLRAGDVAFFPAGMWMTWRVDRYVRKLAFLRHPMPRPLAFPLRAFNFARNWLRLKRAGAKAGSLTPKPAT